MRSFRGQISWADISAYRLTRVIPEGYSLVYASDTSKTVRQLHFSSSSIRRMFMNHGKEMDKTYVCPICKTLGPVVIPPKETRRIVMASSTLYGVWDHPTHA